MSTPPRYLQIGIPYHVYNRGNRKNKIFLNVKDYQRFLRKLKEYTKKFDVSLVCYCLMPNHFHLLLVQKDESAITKFMLSLCTSYSKYFNIKHELVGRLFQARFRTKIVETDEYLLHLSRYIHLNPVELTRMNPVDYPYSSYKNYLGTKKSDWVKPNFILNFFNRDKMIPYLKTYPSYEKFVEGFGKEDEGILDELTLE